MLTGLSIRDVVLIDRLDLEFDGGLGVLTGETGAGKSILLDSLGLALGRRSEAKLVRPGADRASVTAAFEPPAAHPVHGVLAENDVAVEPGEPLLLRRTVGTDGRSKAFVNDQPVGVGLLKQVGESLVEVQGQFDQHGLLNAATHVDLLDAYGNLTAQRRAVATRYAAMRQADDALKDAISAAAKAREEEEYLRFAAEELDRLAPQEGEDEDLAERRDLLRHAENLQDAISAAMSALTGANGADGKIRQAQRSLDRLAEKFGDALNEPVAGLDRASVEIEDVMATLNRVAADLNADSGTLDDVEERLFALREVARKHNVTPAQLATLREDFARRIALIDAGEEKISALQAALATAKDAYRKDAEQLSAARVTAAHALDGAINHELPPLRLDRATFTTQLTALPEDQWGPQGREQIRFTITTNPGLPGGPLEKVASGGELSRVLLATKVALAAVGTVPTLVFDEVDSGVGGATAAAVGERLARLSDDLQVLVVTHSPQVAARGRDHWRVAKFVDPEGRTATSIVNLPHSERREELARMLSGAEITDEARAAATRLLEGTV